MTTLTLVELLDRLLCAAERAAPATAMALQRASPAEIGAFLAAQGFPYHLPREWWTLYGWHNGMAVPDDYIGYVYEWRDGVPVGADRIVQLFPEYRFLPLAEAYEWFSTVFRPWKRGRIPAQFPVMMPIFLNNRWGAECYLIECGAPEAEIGRIFKSYSWHLHQVYDNLTQMLISLVER
jgi:hypothetical protein